MVVLTLIYLAGLAICTWLCWQPLHGWAGYLYLAVLATHYLAGLAICTWLHWHPSTWLG